MIKVLYSFVCLFISTAVLAQTPNKNEAFEGKTSEANDVIRDTVVLANGYSVHTISNQNGSLFTGLNLFSQKLKESFDRELLDYIESALYKRTQNNVSIDDKLSFINGHITDFRKIDTSTPCTVTNYDAKELVVEWNVGEKEVTVSIPIGYDIAENLSRSEIEDGFISRLKDKKDVRRLPFEQFDSVSLEAYREKLYILPGASYQSKDITRNVFFYSDENGCLSPVWDSTMPLESISDMFIYPSDIYGDIEVELTILKHEYGAKEIVEVPLYQLLAVCEQDGCVPFWGVEKFDDGNLEGALFLYNQQRGYDHVMRIKMNPVEVINGTGRIKVRASLFIPTNNVYNLYQPYVKKAEKDKIKYDR